MVTFVLFVYPFKLTLSLKRCPTLYVVIGVIINMQMTFQKKKKMTLQHLNGMLKQYLII